MAIRKTSVAIDEDLYLRTRSALGTESLRETIAVAFAEVLRADARRAEVDALERMQGMDLDDPDVMRGAWRS
jgi:Arc/MetJ family transcription regulator